MNFGAIGETMAFGHVMKTVAQRADRQTDEANEIIARKNRELDDLERQVAVLKAKLAVQEAHTEGLAMQARAVRTELTRVDPKNALLKPTGLKYGAMPQLRCHLVFEQHFDRKAAELGLKGPYEKMRPEAK